MDDNLFFEDGGHLARLVDETLQFCCHAGDVRDVDSYHEDYWPSWPHVVVSFLERGASESSHRDGGVRRMTAGTAAVNIPNVLYHPRILSPGGARFVWTHVDFTIMGSVELLELFEPLDVFAGEEAAELGEINRQLIRLLGAAGLRAVVERRALGSRMLELILRRARPRQGGQATLAARRRLEPLLAELAASPRERWDIARMARTARLSRAGLHQLFKAGVGVSPGDYLIQARCREARWLLLTTSLGVGQIASMVGYDDPFHFSRRFKGVFGVSPLRCRECGGDGV